MKIRNGFVSNSSSSSFIAVGVDRWNSEKEFDLLAVSIFKKRFDEIGEDLDDYMCGQGAYEYNDLDMFGSGGELYLIGVDAESFIGLDMRLSEIKQECQKRFKKNFNIDVPIDKIVLRYGECSG